MFVFCILLLSTWVHIFLDLRCWHVLAGNSQTRRAGVGPALASLDRLPGTCCLLTDRQHPQGPLIFMYLNNCSLVAFQSVCKK